MPDLSQIPSSEALEIEYTDKVMIYVEGPSDKIFFYQIIGHGNEDLLEFKQAIRHKDDKDAEGELISEEELKKLPQGGFGIVKKKTTELRKTNKKVYCLLDGEAAVAFGRIEEFTKANDILFSVEEKSLDGVIFISDHEIENLMIRHSDICAYICSDVSMKDHDSRNYTDVQKKVASLAKRFYKAAILKYAAVHRHHLYQQKNPPINDASCSFSEAGHFQQEEKIQTILKRVHTRITSSSGDAVGYFQEVKLIQRSINNNFRTQKLSKTLRVDNIIRLSDGKELLKKLISTYKGGKNWEGQLTRELKKTKYKSDLEKKLLEFTNVNPKKKYG